VCGFIGEGELLRGFWDRELSLLFHAISFGINGDSRQDDCHENRRRDEPRPHVSRFGFGGFRSVVHICPDYLLPAVKAQTKNHHRLATGGDFLRPSTELASIGVHSQFYGFVPVEKAFAD
jgi:hypothetical protein